jgi:excinuclease ABC subunit B
VMDLGDKPTSAQKLAMVAEAPAVYEVLSTKQIDEKIKDLENQMYKHAQNLEFELAAKTRDDIAKLREQQLST